MRLISVNEVAARLGLSPITVRRLIHRGTLPHVRPTGRTVRVPEDAVEAIITGKAQTPPGCGREHPMSPIRFVCSMGVVVRKKRILRVDSFRSDPHPIPGAGGNE